MKPIRNKTFLTFWATYILIIGIAANVGYRTYQNFQKVTLKIVHNENP